MNLNLKNPLVFFDLETTGTNITTDRIIELAYVKVFPNGKQKKRYLYQSGNTHSSGFDGRSPYYGRMVADKPLFKDVARNIAKVFEGADIAGFNSNRFDVPLLIEELLRAGVNLDISKRKFVDVQTIYHIMEPRTLKAAYKFYCGAPLVDAHSALADTRATYEVFKAQLDRYTEEMKEEYEGKYLTNDIDSWVSFSTQNRNVDFAGRIILNEYDVAVFNFGKYKGRSVEEVFQLEPSYYSWMMQGDFPLNTKNVITEIYTRARRRF